MRRTSMVLIFVLLGGARLGAAQANGCTYDTCALRLHQGFWGPRIVRGVTGEKVAGYGLFAPRLSLFAERSDSAGRYYELFRKSHNQGSGLALAGTVIFAGFALRGALEPNRNLSTVEGVGLTVGTGLLLAGVIRLLPAHNRLSKAIWWYNRTLVRGP